MMQRSWFLLLFMFYYAVSGVRTQPENLSQDETKLGLIDSNYIPTDILLPFKEGSYNFQPEIAYNEGISDSYTSRRKKRSIGSSDKKSRDSISISKVKREIPTSNDRSQIETTTKENQFSENELEEINNESMKNILNLLTKYQTIIDTKISHLFDADGRYELLRKCLHPVVDNKKSFSAWGGKRFYTTRGEQLFKSCLESIFQPKEVIQPYSYGMRVAKMPFKPWNGKRNSEDEFSPKRLPFRAWGGKRDKESGLEPKRIPFRAWGGKRATEKVMELQDARGEGDEMLPAYMDSKRENHKKTKFYSWGGKRSMLSHPYIPISLELINSGFSPKQFLQSVAPWKELSSDGDAYSSGVHTVDNRRLKFNSWGGKRADLEYVPEEGKRTFNAWGGKRGNDEDGANHIEEENEETLENEANKRTFNAWGGK